MVHAISWNHHLLVSRIFTFVKIAGQASYNAARGALNVRRVGAGERDVRRILLRIVVDMTRDLMDVQFYTGEYAAAKSLR